ncbi:MAG TPA: alpha-amylase [Chloroflexota bacterium]|nr:alpha-amylase [Chloroflexota bacterium]
MCTPSDHPFVYEINTRVWLRELGLATLAEVPEGELERLAQFDYVWLMGVWRTGPEARARALAHEELRRAYDAALPGWRASDVGASPYALADYRVADELGGPAGLAALRGRLAGRGVGLLLDFVPNHLGLDHPWAQAHPERFVRRADGRIEHGRDPYFPPWDDTLQLDHRRPETRAAMGEVLGRIADQCDGVRCDMAMLVLREVFERTWGGPWSGGELWAEVIPAVRREHPGFLFLAEAYWDLEDRLQQLGFDYTYDKRLYDLLRHADAWAVAGHLLAGEAYARRCCRFVENHDEERAAASFPPARHRAAATVALTIPGMRLLHDGQLEGRQRRLPVQLLRRAREPLDLALAGFYERLIAAAPRRGAWRRLAAGPPLLAWTWDAMPSGRRQSLVVVNFGDGVNAAQLNVGLLGLAGRPVELWDRLSDERRTVDGDALGDLELGLGPWEARLFDLR